MTTSNRDRGQDVETIRSRYEYLVSPHVQSFDEMVTTGINAAIKSMPAHQVRTQHNDGSISVLRLWLDSLRLSRPKDTLEGYLLPRECREMMKTYSSEMVVDVCRCVTHYGVKKSSAKHRENGESNGVDENGRKDDDSDRSSREDIINDENRKKGIRKKFESTFYKPITKKVGNLPIMVNSSLCNLRNIRNCAEDRRDSNEIVTVAKESETEVGGYFIINGIERVIRMLIMQRRNHVIAIRRRAYANRGDDFSEYAVSIRCVNGSQHSNIMKSYSISNGHEKGSGEDFMIRDRGRVVNDCIPHTVRCHYVNDGSSVISVRLNRNEYFIPAGIVMRALTNLPDETIYSMLVGKVEHSTKDSFVALRAELTLQQTAMKGISSRHAALSHIGRLFRTDLDCDESIMDAEAGKLLIDEYLYCHLADFESKFMLLIMMVRKLWTFVMGDCSEDSTDTSDNQEILLPGHLLTMVVYERFQFWLKLMGRMALTIWQRATSDSTNPNTKINTFGDENHIRRVLSNVECDVGSKVEYMLATGNLVTSSGLELGQRSGFTIVAERINFLRYISHFRSVHRGASFRQLRTTTVRKLLPESYGFMCPVHTPDGSPCGLLLHLSHLCHIVVGSAAQDRDTDTRSVLMSLLVRSGMSSLDFANFGETSENLPVCIDGSLVGFVDPVNAVHIVQKLRKAKRTQFSLLADLRQRTRANGSNQKRESRSHNNDLSKTIPWHVEVALLPHVKGGPFPGLYIFTQPSRMMRPVVPIGCQRNNSANGLESELPLVEFIGSMEQLYMNISCERVGVQNPASINQVLVSSNPTHEELGPTSMLSLIASLTPWSDYNQSPRNMYQCQMAKQTMGTPCHNFLYNTDTKLYRLHTPQRPIARTRNHEAFNIDDFALGTNAVVAVLSYTGYDMEDAMIINKASMDRGFAHACMYKTISLKLKDTESFVSIRNGRSRNNSKSAVDNDGLPKVGETLQIGEPYYCIDESHEMRGRRLVKWSGNEDAVVESVTVIGGANSDPTLNNIRQSNVKLRYNRNPVIGDKFASRHGQKGVLSQLWPEDDMPFCASTGIRPDIIINPHAFPSRMTIGMLIESLASKAGALKGQFQDCTPFQNCSATSEISDPLDEFSDPLGGGSVISSYGKELSSRGFDYYGKESMISGVTGKEFEVETFIGLVYYQRLRHMVDDKYQVRSLGPNDPITQQPIKGRKSGGGIRFGEMERDSLLAHGVSFLVHDRLHACSDYHTTYACSKCGSVISTSVLKRSGTRNSGNFDGKFVGEMEVICLSCKSGRDIVSVAIPYVYKYLAAELFAMNIKCHLTVTKEL